MTSSNHSSLPGLCILLLAIAMSFSASTLFAAEPGGEQLYKANCAECHQSDGEGIPNIYPSLMPSEVVKDSAVDVALVLIIGRGEMPSFDGFPI